MRLKKTESVLWKAAVKNTKLVPEMYTLMRKLTKTGLISIPNQLRGQKAFKEAYHSENTEPFVRAVLLNKILNPTLDINLAMQPYYQSPISLLKQPISFSLLSFKGHLFLNPSHANLDKLSPHIANLQISKNERTNLFEALKSENYKNMKYSLWMHEYKHAWFALIEQFRATIKANDVLKRFYDYEEKKDQKEMDYNRHPIIPDYKIDRFIRDLNHIKSELQKFARVKRILNLDTSHIDAQLEALDGQIQSYLDLPFDEAFEGQYRLFNNMVDIINDVANHIIEVDNIDFSRVEATLPKTFQVPHFVHYNLAKAHQYMQKVNANTLKDDIRRIQHFFVSRKGI